MRNVLIPTDFTAASLAMVEKTAQSLEGESITIILFHAFEIPFYAGDVLTLRDHKLPYIDLVTEVFRTSCKRLKQQYSRTIKSIHIRHMYGNTNAVFRNFVDANDIDLIVIPDFYVFQPVHPGSINPESFFRKAGVPLLTTFKPKQKAADTLANAARAAEGAAQQTAAAEKRNNIPVTS